MKKITAYVNGLRVQDLMKELQELGAREMSVIEYVSSIPKISHLGLLCDDREVEIVRSVIDRIGATGTACDYCFRATDVTPGAQAIEL